jgi:hypothetical protein
MLLAAVGLSVLALAALAIIAAIAVNWSGAKEPVFSAGRPGAAAGPEVGASQPRRERRSATDATLFAPTSFWNQRLSADAPIDPNSATLVATLSAEVQREVQAGIGPWIAAGPGSSPLYRVAAGRRTVRVRLDAPQGVPGRKALQRAFARVPIPRNARPAQGPDRHMTVWQPSTGRLWEFFRARQLADGWHAEWGGAIRRVSKSPGYYTRSAAPGATSNWGATASSLPEIGGTILIQELNAGRIDHTLALNLPAPRAGVHAWPAQRTDGTGPPSALPEGARLRLDPSVNVDNLRLPKLIRMIARAAQRYGMVVRDQTNRAISLFAQDPSQAPTDPYRRYFRGRTPNDLLARFPWDRLQVLRMHLCKQAPCRRG